MLSDIITVYSKCTSPGSVRLEELVKGKGCHASDESIERCSSLVLLVLIALSSQTIARTVSSELLNVCF